MFHKLNNLLGVGGLSISTSPHGSQKREFETLQAWVIGQQHHLPLSTQDEQVDWCIELVRQATGNNQDLPDEFLISLAQFVFDILRSCPLLRPSREISFDELGLSEIDAATRLLRQKQELIREPDRALQPVATELAQLVSGIVEFVPISKLERSVGDVLINVSFIDLCQSPDQLFDGLVATFLHNDITTLGLCPHLQGVVRNNLIAANRLRPDDPKLWEKMRKPSELGLSVDEAVPALFADTPFESLARTPLPFPISLMDRFETTHFVGKPGNGKTSEIAAWVFNHLSQPRDECPSLVIIDSNAKLIKQISRLKIFDPTDPTSRSDDLIIVDAGDVERSPALNLFDVGWSQHKTLSATEREGLLNATIETYEYIFSTLLDVEMTGRQKVMFSYLLQLLLNIPGATINTLQELLQSIDPYQSYIEQLGDAPQRFFAERYNSSKNRSTRTEISARLDAAQSKPYFDRLFSAKRNAINLADVFDNKKVLLINTSKGQLQETGTKLVGRLFMSLIRQAVFVRFNSNNPNLNPVLVFVDESQDYIPGDNVAPQLISQARKTKIGLVFAHQYLGQLSGQVLKALMTSTVRFAGGVQHEDALVLAKEMNTSPEFIKSKYFDKPNLTAHFACTIQGALPRAVSVSRRVDAFNDLPEMSDQAYELLLENNYRRVGDFPTDQTPTSFPEPVPTPEPTLNEPVRPHLLLQEQFAKQAQSLGFQAHIEHPVEGGFIDLVIRSSTLRIAVEISDTNRCDYEVSNITKCLEAGYTTCMVSASTEHLHAIQEHARETLPPQEFASVRFYSPDQFEAWLASQEPTLKPNTVRGFTVITDEVDISPELFDLKRYQLASLINKKAHTA